MDTPSQDPNKRNLRYSRLNAIKDYGIDFDLTKIRNKHVFIAGVGGIGSFSSELLTRMGVGKLTIIDLDVVRLENLNRVFYREEHVGMSKVSAGKKILYKINPETTVNIIFKDLLDTDFEDELINLLNQVDLVLMGLDNVPARQYLNVKVVKTNTPMIDCGALRSGLGGYVHLVIPKKTACYACIGSIKVKTNDVSGPDCAGSLPTTIAILSSLQIQVATKFLIKAGKIPDYIQYNALNDSFKEFSLQRDENCYVCGNGLKPDDEYFLEVEIDSVNNMISKLDKKID